MSWREAVHFGENERRPPAAPRRWIGRTCSAPSTWLEAPIVKTLDATDQRLDVEDQVLPAHLSPSEAAARISARSGRIGARLNAETRARPLLPAG